MLYGEITERFWREIEKNAKKRQIGFLVTPKEAWKIFLIQSRRCALSGEPIEFSSRGYRGTASLDRVDSSKPYTAHNVQWVWAPFNIMKGVSTNEVFINLCRKVVNHNGTCETEVCQL